MNLKIEEMILFVHTYAPNITEWKVLRKELLKNLPPVQRKLFSTRDSITKKQNFNNFENNVVKY